MKESQGRISTEFFQNKLFSYWNLDHTAKIVTNIFDYLIKIIHCNVLTPWKESYDQPRQYIEKQRRYFANKGPSTQGFGFSSGHVRCESWTIKEAEWQRIHAFELWCWRRLLRVSRTARRSSRSILKEVSPGCSLEGLMLKLKLQYFGHLMQRADSFGKTLMLEGIGGRRRRGRQRMGWLDGIIDSMTRVWVDSGSWWCTGRPGMLWFIGSQRVGHDWVT